MTPILTELATLARKDAAIRVKAQAIRGDLLAAIDAAYVEGQTVRQIAEETGLSFQRIYQLVTRPTGPGPRKLRAESEEA